MEIFPAIDLLGGQVVRLYQGDYGKKSTFGDDPAAFAKQFEKAGARYLHLVDLDGAKAGMPQNFDAVRRIAAGTGLFIEFGGGVRDVETVERCFAAGVGRVILGTAALNNRPFFQRMVEKYGDAIAAGVDARDGRVAVEGWLQTSETDSIVFCEQLKKTGVKYIVYTDISRDGTGLGVSGELYRRLVEIGGVNFTDSGGVSTAGDIVKLAKIGVYAAIVGKALYNGAIDLDAALRLAEQPEANA